MDPSAIAGITIAALTGLGIAVTLIVLIARGGFMMGKLVGQVDELSNRVDSLSGQIATLTASVNDLRAEVQQSNQMLAALANHTHDTDGRIVFQLPPSVSR